MDDRVEIRCPGKFRKLFFVLITDYLPRQGSYMEVACSDCAREVRKAGNSVKNVLHYYDSAGAWIKTREIR